MDFADILRYLRRQEGISIKGLAPELGVDYTYLSKLENRKATPSEDVVGRVATYFDYDKDHLLLAAGKIPADVLEILRGNPEEAIAFLRSRFSDAGGRTSEPHPEAGREQSPNRR